MNTVYTVLLSESPAPFGDYARVDLPDGTLQTPYSKV